MQMVNGDGLTSKWEWRCRQCPDWPAKETQLPARRPPRRKPWCCRSLRPLHHHRRLLPAALTRWRMHLYLKPERTTLHNTVSTHCTGQLH
ncbi:hypothetical protein JYU34_015130 [Plutella xylostella]|uniref:Uncharacterized protein n=1 Tax=Plutella xylostella TaxID=51655 RepID=A0ABQ7Q6E6_PLUXY|nr:hypothetical protein JYU34_015130 [Plutella xylostella]